MAGARGENVDMKEEAARFWKFLDQLHDKSPETYDQFVSQTLEDGREMFTPPQPGYCVKLNILPKYNCSVLYLNVCGWKKVPRPKSTDDPVPVKGGILRHKLDKVTNKKINELIYDVAFNPEVLAEVSSSDELEKMLTQLCFTYIEDVVGITVKDKKSYTKLKKKFVGEKEMIQYCVDENYRQYLPQETRADFGDSILKEIGRMKLDKKEDDSSKPPDLPSLKVQPDLSPSPNPGPSDQTKPPSKLIEEISSTTVSEEGPARPDYGLTLKAWDAGLGRAVCVIVSLPGVKSVRDIALDVAKDTLSLMVEGHYQLSVKLPALVNEDSTKAAFKTKTATLTVTMPCL